MSNAPAWQLWVLPDLLDSDLPSLLRFYLIPERNCVLAFANQEVTYLSFHIPMVCDSHISVHTGIRGVRSQLVCLPEHTFSYFSFFRTAHRCAQGSDKIAHLSSCRRSQFSSQHPFGGSQPSVSSFRGGDTLFWCLQALNAMIHADTPPQDKNKLSHKKMS